MTDNTMEYMTVSMCGANALDWCRGYNSAVTKANEIINRQKAKIEKQDKEIKKIKNAKYVHCHVDYCADDLAKALKENKRLKEEVKNLTSANKNLTSDLTSSRAENESLEVSLQAMRNVANGYKSAYERAEGKRKTALQDFADILISDYPEMEYYLNNLVKETGGMDFTQIFMNVKKIEPLPDMDLQAIMEGKQHPQNGEN